MLLLIFLTNTAVWRHLQNSNTVDDSIYQLCSFDLQHGRLVKWLHIKSSSYCITIFAECRLCPTITITIWWIHLTKLTVPRNTTLTPPLSQPKMIIIIPPLPAAKHISYFFFEETVWPGFIYFEKSQLQKL